MAAMRDECPRIRLPAEATVRVEVGPGEFRVPPLPFLRAPATAHDDHHDTEDTDEPMATPLADACTIAGPAWLKLSARSTMPSGARAEAHRRVPSRSLEGAADLIGRQLAFQLELLEIRGRASSPDHPTDRG